MTSALITILAYLFIYLVYLVGKLLVCVRLGIHDRHLFLGWGHDPAFSFGIGKIKISVGLFIPLPFLAKFYSYQPDGSKERIHLAWEYIEKPISHRFLVNFGGAVAMLLVACVMFFVAGLGETETFVGKDQVDKFGIYPDSLARSYGFAKGDRIQTVNDRTYERHIELKSRFLEQDPTVYTVLRNNREVTIEVGQEVLDQLTYGVDFLSINAPFEVTKTSPGSEAERIGLQSGDVITQIADKSVSSIDEFGEFLKEYAGDTVMLQIQRGDQTISKTSVVPAEGLLGFTAHTQIEFSSTRKTLGEALKYGIAQPFELIFLNVKGLITLVSKEHIETMRPARPMRIADLFGKWNWVRFFKLTGMLLSVFVFYEMLPLPRTAMTRSIPLLAEGLFNRHWTIEGYRKLNKVLWSLVLALFLWNVISDIAMLF